VAAVRGVLTPVLGMFNTDVTSWRGHRPFPRVVP